MRSVTVLMLIAVLLHSSDTVAGPLRIVDVDDAYPIIPEWPGLTVLHIGDSHVSAGLKIGLARHLKAVGALYLPICWVGSQAKSWVVSGKLRKLIVEHKPDVVIVTLGTNIMKNAAPSRYEGWVRALVEKLGGRTCYWLGPPPLLDDEKGFNEMLKTNTGPCRYFDARALSLSKRDDGKFHLTKAQGEAWAEQVWLWMNGMDTDQPPGNSDAL
jgi:hypothetical protein